MAGQPKTYRVRKALEARAVRELGEDTSAFRYAVLWLSSGQSMLLLARSLGEELSEDVSRETVRRIVNQSGESELGSERAASDALARAREIGASALAEEAGTILDDVSEDRDAITKAKARAEYRQWLAGHWSREEYGKTAQTQVSINVGDLHLIASQSYNARKVATAKQLRLSESVEDAEGIVVE
jgi:hypothetical protein